MSNQDPYGPSPQQPHGQQPYGQEPFGQQPYGQQPPGGGQVFGSGPGYPPPPPPKKRTGLIIGAIVAALVVIGGLAVGGVLLLGDDDKSDESSETAKDEPTDEASESEDPTEEPTDEPTEEPTDGDGKILGTNYTYSLPGEEWTDVTAEATTAGTVVDSAAVFGAQFQGSRANVLVEAHSAGGSTVEDLRANWEENLTSGGKSLQRKPDVTIDGEKAYAVELQGTNASGTEVFQSVYLTVHQDILYSIAFTSQPADDEAEEGFDAIQGSWAWTS